jgi:hypothetical protein
VGIGRETNAGGAQGKGRVRAQPQPCLWKGLFLNAEEPLRVAVRYSLPVGVADRKPVEERAALGHRLIGMIGREHDAFDADLQQQFEKRRLGLSPPYQASMTAFGDGVG